MLNKTYNIDKSSKTTVRVEESHIHKVDASGSIAKTEQVSRFIMINTGLKSFNTLNSQRPHYLEIEQKQSGRTEATIGQHNLGWDVPIYETTTTKVYVDVLNVLLVGEIATLEIVEKERTHENSSDWKTEKDHFKNPTII